MSETPQILVIDDDPAFNRVLSRALKSRGEQVLDFGCCELRFPTSTLLTVQHKQ